MIELKNFKLFSKDRILLDALSFKSSHHLAIMGPSGSGKSLLAKSLIKLFASNLRFEAEVLRVLDFNLLKNTDLEELRRQVAYIFQDAKASFAPLLDIGRYFSLCAKRELRNARILKQKSFELFESLNLKDCERIWHSYVYELSTGEAMRVQFALALLRGARLLICDELNSNLDSKNIKNITELLQNLKKDLRLILISHDFDFVKNLSEELVFLKNGKILEHLATKDFDEALIRKLNEA